MAAIAARLFHEGLFPWVVFTGANAPTTVERFPRGEAVHYREYAERGFAVPQEVPGEARAAFDRLVAAGYPSRLV